MGSKGDCFDNAVAESFFATIKKELIHRRAWPTKTELRTEIFDYIEVFYNRQRRHSTLGQRSPVDYENSPLSPSRPIDAASRLPSQDQITIMSRSPATQLAYQPVSTETGEVHTLLSGHAGDPPTAAGDTTTDSQTQRPDTRPRSQPAAEPRTYRPRRTPPPDTTSFSLRSRLARCEPAQFGEPRRFA